MYGGCVLLPHGLLFSLGFHGKDRYGRCLVHNIFHEKCLQVNFTLSQDNFILVDVISMCDMSFVFKNA